MTETNNLDNIAFATARTGQLFALLSSPKGTLEDVANSYVEIEGELRASGYDLKEFLPGEERERLGFDAPDWATRFFESYGKVVRKALCDKEGDLRSHVDIAMTSGTASLINALLAALAIPTGAAILLAPIAATLLVRGTDAFCSMDA